MANIEDLIASVSDERLRKALAGEVKALKRTKQFGLVFEEHLPETVQLPSLPIKVGEFVTSRNGKTTDIWRVKSIKKGSAICENADRDKEDSFALNDLVVVRSFGQPIYPALTPSGLVERSKERPWHTVLNSDNFHALQLLLYAYEGKIDAIYIDPPYNTGARDWKYNNQYVDEKDVWRNSKWLSMMQKRLRLAKRLLNPDNSVLIVTIDEKEVHHLGMLLEQMFRGSRIQMVSSLINPAMVARAGEFGRSDEYIFFVMIGSAGPERVRLSREWVSAKGRTHTGNLRWDLLRRSGTNTERERSPGCFYPIYIDPAGPKVAKVGEPVPTGQAVPAGPKGTTAVLPIRKNGSDGVWQWAPETFRERLAEGRVRITGSAKKGFVVSILKPGEYAKIKRGEFTIIGKRPDGSIVVDDIDADEVLAVPGSQWRVSSHDASQYGSRLLGDLLPDRRFPFPKSLYAVEDALRFFVGNKPDALVLDFFAGSGTTLHAVARLNHADSGQRRCILVTNNEVSADEAAALRKEGFSPGDPEWERLGIFEYITKPRITAAFSGVRTDGQPAAGSYKFGDEFPMSDGFDENVEFFRLDYLDPAVVARGDAFQAILPILWMIAGCKGAREDSKGSQSWFFPKNSPFAVLLRERDFRAFRDKLAERPDVTHVFLVTDSEENFAMMRRSLGTKIRSAQLYKSYLETFRLNTDSSLLTGGTHED